MKTAPNLAKQSLIRVLQNAYSGELAAFHAYDGHWRSVADPKEKSEIKRIRDEEWEHRECVGQMLMQLNAHARPRRERLMKWVGLTIGFLCRIGGWMIPMYGAGKLESGNIVEYEIAAQLAADSGQNQMIEPLLKMAEVEWDHELYFREKFLSHPLRRLLPMWKIPPPRETIRLRGPSNKATAKAPAQLV